MNLTFTVADATPAVLILNYIIYFLLVETRARNFPGQRKNGKS